MWSRTTFTPRPPVSSRVRAAKSSVRQSIAAVAPSSSQRRHLAGLPAVTIGRWPGRRRVEALALEQVGAVHAGGLDTDAHVGGAERRTGDVADDEHPLVAGLADQDGTHRASDSMARRACQRYDPPPMLFDVLVAALVTGVAITGWRLARRLPAPEEL